MNFSDLSTKQIDVTGFYFEINGKCTSRLYPPLQVPATSVVEVAVKFRQIAETYLVRAKQLEDLLDYEMGLTSQEAKRPEGVNLTSVSRG